MSSNNHANKARGQTMGAIDAPWFKKRVARNRRRLKLAKAAKKINRKN